MESLNIEKMSIRISKELKEEIEKLNIDTKNIVEKPLIDAIERAKKRKLEETINALLPDMEKSQAEWIRVVKECRKER
jgi:hypothetical protein